jgi:hypothetical protein
LGAIIREEFHCSADCVVGLGLCVDFAWDWAMTANGNETYTDQDKLIQRAVLRCAYLSSSGREDKC